jgi:hypothetical protein
MKTYSLTKFFNFETSVSVCVYTCVRARVWIISQHIETLDVIILPMHLQAVFP